MSNCFYAFPTKSECTTINTQACAQRQHKAFTRSCTHIQRHKHSPVWLGLSRYVVPYKFQNSRFSTCHMHSYTSTSCIEMYHGYQKISLNCNRNWGWRVGGAEKQSFLNFSLDDLIYFSEILLTLPRHFLTLTWSLCSFLSTSRASGKH